MIIKYDAYWKTEKGYNGITNGFLDDCDIEAAVKLKEDLETIDNISVESITL